MGIISVDNVTKSFGAVQALKETSLDIEHNEFFALLGPSGCGKTTLLRMLAGFEEPTSGRILIDGQDMARVPPNKRAVNMVFQSYAVFPHMTVEANVGYGLKVTGTPAAETATAAAAALDLVGLSGFAKRMPDQLSGGQRQRVALARALVKRPKVMLLDEPLSALDAKLREQMQLELAKLQMDVGITFIIVTHDQDEALSMADRIAVMSAGEVQQVGSPAAIYESPANRFVADFIGKVNLIAAEVSGADGDRVRVSSALGTMALAHDGPAEGAVSVALRPEKIRISPEAPPDGDITATGTIAQWAYYGDISNVFIDTAAGQRLSVVLQNDTRTRVHAMDIGDTVHLAWSSDDALLLAT